MKIYYYLFVLFFLIINRIEAQPDFSNPLLNGCCPEVRARLDSIINNAPYIFEGRMVKPDYSDHYSPDGTNYRSFLFEVDKVYRGGERLKEGTVEVITKLKPAPYGRINFVEDTRYIVLGKEDQRLDSFPKQDSNFRIELFYDVKNFSSYFRGGIYHRVKDDGTFKKWNPSYSGLSLNFRTKSVVRSFLKGYGLESHKPKKQEQVTSANIKEFKRSQSEIKKGKKGVYQDA